VTTVHPETPLRILYTNHRGETAWRTVTPIQWFFGTTDWHPEVQWFVHAIDADKGGPRTFALKDIHRWEAAP
jgi:hypothetical protein